MCNICFSLCTVKWYLAQEYSPSYPPQVDSCDQLTTTTKKRKSKFFLSNIFQFRLEKLDIKKLLSLSRDGSIGEDTRTKSWNESHPTESWSKESAAEIVIVIEKVIGQQPSYSCQNQQSSCLIEYSQSCSCQTLRRRPGRSCQWGTKEEPLVPSPWPQEQRRSH